jgi:hypothetical protein
MPGLPLWITPRAGGEEDVVADETVDPLAAAIRDHLDLKRRNSVLEYEMPLANYMASPAPDASRQSALPPDDAITEEVATSIR